MVRSTFWAMNRCYEGLENETVRALIRAVVAIVVTVLPIVCYGLRGSAYEFRAVPYVGATF